MRTLPMLPGLRFKPYVALSAAVLFALSTRLHATELLQPNSRLDLNGHSATLTSLETLPFVENEYSRRFTFDSAENPKLKELRERFKLDEVVAPGRGEFAQQLLLLHWAHERFKKFGQPSTKAKGALEVLQAIDEGNTFFCAQYAEVLVSAAASMGWVDRPLALRRHQGVNKVGGSTEHSVTEIWSNEHRKWVMLDPTSDMYLERDGVPLNAYEIRQEWFYREGRDLVFVVGREGRRYRKADLPIQIEKFAGFGDLTVEPDELDKYGFIGYIPNTNLMNAGDDYGAMFIVRDALCDGTQWHVRKVPADPEREPYFPLDQANIAISEEGGKLKVALKTLTPNFQRFEVQKDDGTWAMNGEIFEWGLHPGSNRLKARAVNAFGVAGPVSTAEVVVRE